MHNSKYLIIGTLLALLSIVGVNMQTYRTGLDKSCMTLQTINPNSASFASLIRLPNVGTTTAQSIIAYRIAHQQIYNGTNAFNTANDLENVKRIGSKTVLQLQQYLKLK